MTQTASGGCGGGLVSRVVPFQPHRGHLSPGLPRSPPPPLRLGFLAPRGGGGVVTATPNQGSDADVCPAGYYCEEGSAEPTACPSGTYSNTTGLRNVTDCTSCNPGECCPPYITSKPICSYLLTICYDAGYYCQATALLEPSGLCSEGFYCGSGSVSASQNVCPVGRYCPIGKCT